MYFPLLHSRTTRTVRTVDAPGSSLLPPDGNPVHDQSVGSFVTARSRTSAREIPESSSPLLPDRAKALLVSREGKMHHRPTPRRQRPPNRGLSVLPLYGGGVRGIITLLVLKSLLRLIQPEGDIFPYLYFDLICGTSTGGLIAILLGVLHLDIDTTIMLYRKLSKKIFRKGYSRVRFLVKDAGYDRTPLERAVNKILNEHGKGRTLMEDPVRDRGCRCFVTTTHCVGQRRDVLPIRSYRSSGEQSIPNDYSWTILDAALATSVAPGYFDRYQVNMNGQQFAFEDAGANLMNNPSKLAWEECRKLDGLKNSLFIGLGTGINAASIDRASGILGLFRNKFTIFKASKRHLTNVNDVHKWMENEASRSTAAYYSHDPRIPGKIGLADWDKMAAMEATAVEYVNDAHVYLRQCADNLAQFQV